MGIGIIGRPAPSSFPGERAIEVLVSIGMMIFSVCIFLRQSWAFYGLICSLFLVLVDCLFTFRLTEDLRPLLRDWGAAKVTKLYAIFVFLVLGFPIVLLIWLRPFIAVR
jgi:hypothetical protein